MLSLFVGAVTIAMSESMEKIQKKKDEEEKKVRVHSSRARMMLSSHNLTMFIESYN